MKTQEIPIPNALLQFVGGATGITENTAKTIQVSASNGFSSGSSLFKGTKLTFKLDGVSNDFVVAKTTAIRDGAFDLQVKVADDGKASVLSKDITGRPKATLEDGAFNLAFNDIKLNIGEFATNLLSPVINGVNDVIEPLHPVVDVLTADVKFLSKIGLANVFDEDGDGQASLLEVALNLAPALGGTNKQTTKDKALKFFNMVNGVVELSNSLDDLAKSLASGAPLELEFGNYVLQNFKGASNKTDPTKITLPNGNKLINRKDDSTDNSKLNNSKLNNFFSKLNNLGIKLDIIENPLNLIKLFLGQDIDLVKWDAPELDLGFSIEKRFPIFLGIQGLLKGDFSAKSDLVFGFDTAGLSAWKKEGFAPEESYRILDGFYLSDVDPVTGQDVNELELEATIAAGVGAGVVIASVEGTGGITGTAGLDIIDIGEYSGGSDGRVRGSEIVSRIDNPTSLFKIAGALEAFLNLAVKVGVNLGFWKAEKTVFEKDLARVTLFEFALGGNSSGVGSNGFIDGATVFFDANFNGLLDEGESVTTTDASGSYGLDIGVEFDLNGDGKFDTTEGRLILQGGTDIISNTTLDSKFFAPAGASVITPLTSLMQHLIEDGLTSNAAEELVKQSFNLPDAVTLTQFNAVQEVLANNSDGVAVYAKHVQVNGMFNITRELVGEYLANQGIQVDPEHLQDWTVDVLAQGLQDVGAPETITNLNQYIPLLTQRLDDLAPADANLDKAALQPLFEGWATGIRQAFASVDKVTEGVSTEQAIEAINTVKATIQKDVAGVFGELGRNEITVEALETKLDQFLASPALPIEGGDTLKTGLDDGNDSLFSEPIQVGIYDSETDSLIQVLQNGDTLQVSALPSQDNLAIAAG